MAEFCIGMHQYRNQSVESPFQDCITVDVDHLERKAKLAANGRQCSEHVVA